MVRTVSPNARATPSNPIPTCGKAAARTALPHPPNTSQNVPRNSATARFERDISDLGRPRIYEATMSIITPGTCLEAAQGPSPSGHPAAPDRLESDDRRSEAESARVQRSPHLAADLPSRQSPVLVAIPKRSAIALARWEGSVPFRSTTK